MKSNFLGLIILVIGLLLNGGAALGSGSFPEASSPAIMPAPSEAIPVVGSPAPSIEPVASTVPADIVSPIPIFIEKVWAFLQSAGGFIAGFVVVFEIFVRAFPTKNPLSILVPVKHFIDVSILILTWLSNLLVSLINAANKSETKIEKKELK